MRAALFDRVLTLSPAFFETMRTGDVLTRLNADTVLLQSSGRLGDQPVAAQPGDRARRLGHAGRDQRQAGRRSWCWWCRWSCCRWCCSAAASAGWRGWRRTAWPISAPMPRRRVNALRTVQAFTHERGRPRPVRRAGRGEPGGVDAPGRGAGAADHAGDPAGLRRDHLQPVGRRARRGGRPADAAASCRPSCSTRCSWRPARRGAQRAVGRGAARGGGGRADRRVAGRAAVDRGARAPDARCRRRHGAAARSASRTSASATRRGRTGPRSKASTCTCGPARRWRWWGRAGPARPRCSNCCCASTTRRAADPARRRRSARGRSGRRPRPRSGW